jgi:hypothetical protein
MKLRVEDVQGRNCLTQFWGMDYTTDKLRAMVRKWQTLIEAHVDVKTTDGYTLRMFAIGFTKKRPGQIKRTAYAKSAQVCGAKRLGGAGALGGCARRQGPRRTVPYGGFHHTALQPAIPLLTPHPTPPHPTPTPIRCAPSAAR